MKKFIAKLAIFSILNVIIVVILNIPSTFAQNSEARDEARSIAGALTDAKNEPCVKNKTDDDPDYNYIITIIEEPLTLEKEGQTPDDDYATRI
ncbi:hypothetical protein GF366_03355, partial [Candidatus Peregrinibacteria bacterium]|nr:hypothetical protein [Candidatus Peregrinibacteria bacterium]